MEKRLYEVKKKGPTEECDSDHYELKETIDGATITTLYVETHAPNRKMLKWMLESAVGLSRTLPQFAKDCSLILPISNSTKGFLLNPASISSNCFL